MNIEKQRIAYFSDLHLEHYENPWGALTEMITSIEWFDADYVVIAGDLGNQSMIARYLSYMSGFMEDVSHIFYVPGNHEFYGGHIHDGHKLKNESLPDNVHILYRDSYLDKETGILFVGAVGFPDGSFRNPYEAKYYKKVYNDFKYIKGFGKLGKEYGQADHRVIERLLEESKSPTIGPVLEPPRKKVVITHFLPLPDCIEIKYLGDAINACYVNDYREMIIKQKPDVWFYGHTHSKNTVEAYCTNFCINAIGYPSDRNCHIRAAIYEI